MCVFDFVFCVLLVVCAFYVFDLCVLFCVQRLSVYVRIKTKEKERKKYCERQVEREAGILLS